jgi:predicted metalloprotease
MYGSTVVSGVVVIVVVIVFMLGVDLSSVVAGVPCAGVFTVGECCSRADCCA